MNAMKKNFKTNSLLLTGILLWVMFSSFGKLQDKGLEVGSKVPAFQAINDQGKKWNSSDFIGQKILVVYFYPAAMTGGCTKQACSFRDDKASLDDLDVEIAGISGDLPEGLKVFRKAHDLNFTLLSDPKGKIAKMFGVPLGDGGSIQREIDGHEVTLTRGVTASRWTFIIGKDGKVLYKNDHVNAAEDSKNVISIVQNIERKQ